MSSHLHDEVILPSIRRTCGATLALTRFLLVKGRSLFATQSWPHAARVVVDRVRYLHRIRFFPVCSQAMSTVQNAGP
jgi:hypothetical protein